MTGAAFEVPGASSPFHVDGVLDKTQRPQLPVDQVDQTDRGQFTTADPAHFQTQGLGGSLIPGGADYEVQQFGKLNGPTVGTPHEEQPLRWV